MSSQEDGLNRGNREDAFTPGVVLHERYEILSKIGEGGFGEVYKARQLATGQLVALKKMLRPASEDKPHAETRTARFLRETRLCALLHHPNIVQLMDAGTAEDGQLFTVFSFVPGENLAQVLKTDGPLLPQEAGHLMLQVLDALACAHAQGVVHRDLKPSNIMVVRTGARRNAVVLDFGIGALVSSQPFASSGRLTGSREVLGTLGYAAPEQCLGGEVYPSADLFSWGLVFIECLTGKPPYAGSSEAEVIYRLLGPDPIPIPKGLAGHPIGELLCRATRKEVSARDLSAHTLLHALEACDLKRLPRGMLDEVSPDSATGQSIEPHLKGEAFSEDDRATKVDQEQSTKERRHLTALCCRIAVLWGETASSDVEEADDLLRATLALCASLVRKHGGRVTTALGDQLLVYFGVPRAEENATKRAGRAALAIAEAIRTENDRLSAQGGHIDVRIGIHTGLLVAARDASDPKGHSAVGETPRLAASLASSAAPGTVLVTADVERLLRTNFDIESLGTQPVAGMAGQMRLFRLEKHRGDPTSNSGSTEKQARLIGRDHELQMLLERWRRTVAGTGQCILITGEPGIGKSRLAAELCNCLAAKEHSRLEGRCLPDGQNDALFPFVQIVESALGIDRQEPPEASLARLETGLSFYGLDLSEIMPLMLDLLSLPIRPPYGAPDVSPQRRMELQQGAMLSLFFGMAEKRPLLLLVEDLHWASPTAVGFLTRLLREAPEYPICVVMTARPEVVPSFSTAAVLQLPLAHLDADETRAMASELVGGKSLSPGFIDTVLSRTDGIPLFIEELTRLILETGAVKETEGGLEVSTALPDAVMPGPLRALISARLDRLDRAKATAAVAAALGREFSIDVLCVASTLGPQAVQEDLETLTNAGLIIRRGRRKDAMATFKHALVRDAAYDSLPRVERQKVHGRIADVLEERFPEISRARPELLAHHFAAAHRALQAIPYAQKAAEQALNRCAYNEAIAIASKMLDWTPTLAKGDAVSARLAANVVLTQALMTTRGWGDPQIKKIAEESTALLQQLPPSNPNKLPILWSLYIYHHTASQRPAARKVAEEICTMAEELQDEGLRAVSAVVLGATFHAEGHMDGAGRALDKAIALYRVDKHRDHGIRFGIDTLVWAKALLAHIRWFEGDDTRAFELVHESMAWARELAHVPSIALGLMYGAQVYQLIGDKAKVAAMTEEILSLSGKYGLPAYEGYASILHAWTTGNEQPIEQILGLLGAMGCNLGLSYFSSLPADIFADRGDLGAAIAVIDRCLSLCEQNDEHHYEHFLHWRHAMYRSQSGSAEGDVQTSLKRAMEVAKRCGARRVEALALRIL